MASSKENLEEHIPTEIPGTSSHRSTNSVKGRVKEFEKYGKEQHIVNSQSIAFPHHSVYGGISKKDPGDICKMCVAKKSKPTPHLNLVLLGMEGVKASISKILLGEKPSVVRTESSSMCVNQGQVCGHLITLVEMPTLYNTQLSEEEVMHLTQCCVSVCNPGVHAFLIAVPDGPLTNDDKAELDTVQNIFSSRVNDHTIFIINQKSQRQQLDKMLQSVINARGGRYTLYSSSTNAEKFFTPVKTLLKENNNCQYTMAMYFDAQIETQLQYKRENRNLQQQITELKMSKRNEIQDIFKNPETLRIVLLGKTGVGKSATGNTILGRKLFKEMPSAQTVTCVCQKMTGEINGRQITVVDTPGLFDTQRNNDETRMEIVKCISMAAPGPHVFLLVLSLGRFTEQEMDAVKIIEKSFGKKSNMYTIVLFTRGDDLKKMPIEQYIETAGPKVNRLLQACDNRYHVFINKDESSNTQVLTLLDKIDSMVKENGGSCYTNEMFQEVEEALEKEKERILKEREKQIEREKEELKKKHEAQIEEMRREMQRHKERQETEKRQKEKEFKEREEKIKKEMAKQEKQLREDFRKRKDEDDVKMKEEEMNREREVNQKQWERQREEDQKRRDKEEEERRKKEQEWKEKQGEEKEKFKREKEQIKKNKEVELKKLQKEFQQKTVEEEKRRRDLEEKIKDAEESKKKNLQLSQQREWERRMREEEKQRKDQEKIWEISMTNVDKKWSLDQMRKKEQYDRERQKEKDERELKENKRKEKEEQEKKRIENDFNEKIRKMEEQVKVQREEDERERKKKDEENRKEMEEKLLEQQEEFIKERKGEERKQNEETERNLGFIRDQHKKEQEKLKRETEEAARKQAEEEFTAELDKKVKEARASGFKEGCEKVESERRIVSKFIDDFWK